ncbi:fibronectin type III domain-containing protein [Bacteriovorax sp. BSW11_IV]|uniref:fibronectin type III domain-containing protein n=1 Tax=Bacteriovorax sp. BSW11_IV TaxID=1353529 RepID=UPI0035105C93
MINGPDALSDDSTALSGAVYVFRNKLRFFNPKSFRVASTDDNSINLEWIKADNITTGYYIAYLLGDTPPADCSSGTIVNVGNVESYTLSSLQETETYSFRICSYNGSGDVSAGETVSASTTQKPYEVANLHISNRGYDFAQATWEAGSVAASGYVVAILPGATAPDLYCTSGTITDIGNNFTHLLSGLTINQDYSIRVCAYNASNQNSKGKAFYIQNGWYFEAYLKADNSEASDNFGRSISINGNNLIIGAYGEDSNQSTVTNGTSSTDNSLSSSGAAYLFTRTNSLWTQSTYFKAVSPDSSDAYGGNVSIDGDTIVIGATGEDGPGNTITNGPTASSFNTSSGSGAVYVYKLNAGNWEQEAYIKASNAGANDYFGNKVQIENDTLIVSATGEDSAQSTITNGTGSPTDDTAGSSGAVYVYKRTGSNWAQEAYIKSSNIGASDSFGTSVKLNGDYLVVGATGEDSNQTHISTGVAANPDNSSSSSGAVYLFRRYQATWYEYAYFKSVNSEISDSFGASVAVSGDTIAVGASGEDSNSTSITNGQSASADNSNSSSGAVYVFINNNGTWEQQAYLKSSNSGASDYFGTRIDLSGDTLVVAATGEDNSSNTIVNNAAIIENDDLSSSGAVYVFKRNGTTWSQESYLKSPAPTSNDSFGSEVTIEGNTIVVAASAEDGPSQGIFHNFDFDTNDTASASGAVYVFRNYSRLFAPSNFAITADNGSDVTLSWNAVAGATGYKISYLQGGIAPADCNTGTAIDVGNVTTHTFTGLTTNDYSFRICSYNATFGDHEGYTLTRSTSTGIIYPSDPTNFMASTTGTNNINLTWTAAPAAAGYKLAYALGDIAPADCHSGTSTDLGNVTSTSVTGLQHNSNYSFTICSYNAVPQYSYGAKLSAATQDFPFELSELRIASETRTNVQLAWISAGGATAGFYISYQANTVPANCSAGTVIDTGNVTTYNITGLDSATEYYFRVCAYDGALNTTEGRVISRLNGWYQSAFIKAANVSGNALFGDSVKLDGDTLAISAPGQESSQTTITNGTGTPTDTLAPNSGAVYIYRKSGNDWTQEAFIKANNAETNDNFGASIDLQGDYLIVTAPNEDTETNTIWNYSNNENNNRSSDSGAVYVYKRTGTNWEQEAFIKAPNFQSTDKFGDSISIDGNTIVVGVSQEDSATIQIVHAPDPILEYSTSSNRGAVYIFGKDGSGKWQFEAYIKRTYDSSDYLGTKVFTKDNLIFATSPGDDSSFNGILSGSVETSDDVTNSGAVFVFAKGEDNKWSQEAFIKASNNSSNDIFGTSISYSNNYLAVGAEEDDSNQNTITNGDTNASTSTLSSNSGAVFVYKRDNKTWKQHAYIKPSNVNSNDNFGHAVSISGNLLAVSAYKQDSNQNFTTNGAGASTDTSLSASGAVYLFKRTNETWNQIAFIKPTNPKSNINFGSSLNLKGNLLAVGTNNNDSGASGVFYSNNFSESFGFTNSGAVHIFTNKSDPFDPYELAATPAQNSVTLNWIKTGENNAGYMIAYSQSLTPPADCSSGTTIDVGDTNTFTVNSLLDARSYSFRVCGYDPSSQLSAGIAITTETLASSSEVANLQITARDNTSISLSWDASSAPVTGYRISYSEGYAENYYCNTGTTIDVGNVTSYQLTSLTHRKGYSINVCGIYPLGNTKGALLNAPDFGWYQEAFLKSFANNLFATAYFGSSISLDDDTVAVGTIDDKLNITSITNSTTIDPTVQTNLWDSGAVYIYRRTGQTWAGEALIKAYNPQLYGAFGDQISLSGDKIAVANFENSQEYTVIVDGKDPDFVTNDNLYRAGSVYIYKRTGSTWALEQYIRPPLVKSYQQFGIDVSLSENTIAIGADYDSSNATNIFNSSDAPIDNSDSYASGATYIYYFNGSTWVQQAFIKASNNGSQDYFGSSVALKGDLLVVGSPSEDSISTSIINGSTSALDNDASDSGAIYVYKRSDNFWEQEAYIKASNNIDGLSYGYNIDVDGNYIIAGVVNESSNTSNIINGETSSTNTDSATSGAVYVYKKDNGIWKQDAYIKAPNPDSSDYFGTSVAISGQRIAVGSYQEDTNQNYITNIDLPSIDNNLLNSGAVYTFTRENGLWEFEAFIKAGNAGQNDTFGSTVDLQGDTLVVGAPKEGSEVSGVVNGPIPPQDNNNGYTGAVYIYRNLIDRYSPANLIASYTDSRNITLKWRKSTAHTGYKIAYVMGSIPQASCEGSNSIDVGWVDTHTFTNLTPGINYSFTICGYNASAELSLMQTLTHRTTLPPRGPATLSINDIKTSTFIAQWTAVQSANIQGYRLAYKTGNIPPVNCTSETNLDVGNVLNYKLTGLLAYNTYSIRVCPYDNNNIIGQGLTATANTLKDLWYQESFIKTANNDPFDLFGSSVDLFADTLIVGAPGEDTASTIITSDITAIDNNNAESSGGVYIYKRTYEDWALHTFIKSSNSDLGDNFGQIVSIHKDTIAVGAPLEDSNQNTITNGATSSADNSSKDSGAVYIYKIANDVWTQEAYIKSPYPDIDDEFGSAIDLNENTLVVGAYREDGDQTTIINGTTASATNTSIDSGGAYIYFRTGNSWTQEAYIKAINNDSGNFFAKSVAVDLNTVAIGAPKEDSNSTTIINGTTASSDSSSSASGAVYIYKRTGANWAQESYIKAPNNNESDYFGSAVALRGDQLAVGAPEEDSNEITITNGPSASSDNNALSSGAVYVFERSGSNWNQTAYIKASNANTEDHFGSSLSLGQNTLVVGAKDEDSSQRGITLNSSPLNDAQNSGAAYIYRYNGINWSQESYLKSINSDANDNFGTAVAMSGDTIAIGAPGESAYLTEITNNEIASTSNDSQNSGAVYIYRYIGRIFDIVDLRGSIDINTNIKLTWNRLAYASGYKISYQTGTTAPLDCNTATQIDVGSVDNYTVTGLTPGLTYSFRVCGYDNTPTYSDGAIVTVTKPNPPPNPTSLTAVADNSKSVTLNWISGGASTTGFKVAFNIGTTPPTSCTDGTIIDVGNVTTHTETNFPHYSRLSFRVCSYNALGDLSSGETINAISRVGGWYQEAYIKPNTNEKELYSFGKKIDFDGKQIAASSTYDTYLTKEIEYGSSVTVSPQESGSVGAVYIFERTGDNWEQKAYIKPPNAASGDRFGQDVSFFGNKLAVSVENDNNPSGTYFNGKYTLEGDGNSAGAIHIFNKVGSVWTPEAFIKPKFVMNTDGFGKELASYNDTIIVGASGERTVANYIQNGEQTVDSNASGNSSAGAVYVFRNKGQGWYSEAFIKPTNIQAGDMFGISIAIEDNYIAVGAPGEDSNQTTISNDGVIIENNSNPDAGSVYIFKRTDDLWTQDAYIKAANSESYDNFGVEVELKNNYLIVSASGEDSFTTTIINGTGTSSDNSWGGAGAIYVYKKNAGNWEQDAYIKLSNTGVHEEWYSNVTSLSLDGDTLVLGNRGDPSIGNIILNGPNASTYGDGDAFWDVGSVFVYRRTAAGWEQEAYIQASNSQLGSQFGEDVVIKGDTIVVGSSGEGSSFRSIINGPVTNETNIYSVNSGAVYVYRNKKRLFEASTVALESKTNNSLTLSWLTNSGSAVGYKIAYQQGSAPADCNSGTVIDVGNVSNYVLTGLLQNTTYGVRICSYDVDGNDSTGQVYTYTTDSDLKEASNVSIASTTVDSITLTWTDASPGATTGYKLAYALGDTAPVDCNSGTSLDLGLVTTYSITGLTPLDQYTTRLCAYDASALETTGVTRSARVQSSGWNYKGMLQAPIPESNDAFGSTLAMSEKYFVVGHPFEDSNQTTITSVQSQDNSLIDSGAVHVYEKVGNAWQYMAFIKASNPSENDNFGTSVAIHGDKIAVGVPNESSSQSTITNGTTASSDNSNTKSGAVYVYKNNAGTWTQEAYIKASNNTAGDLFGTSVDIKGDLIAVGAPFEASNQNTITTGSSASSDESLYGSGATYVFTFNGSIWNQTAYIKAANSGFLDKFGHSVAIGNDTHIAVAAIEEDSIESTIINGPTTHLTDTGLNTGAIYVYEFVAGSWQQQAFIKKINPDSDDRLGETIKFDNDTIVATSPAEDSTLTGVTNGTTASTNNSATNAGAIFVYRKTNGIWAQEAFIKSNSSGSSEDFGHAMDFKGDTIVASAPNEDSDFSVIYNSTNPTSNSSLMDSGAVHVFKRVGTLWAQEAMIKSPRNYLRLNFGASVAIHGNQIAVGEPKDSGDLGNLSNNQNMIPNDLRNTNSGSVLFFENNYRVFEVTNIRTTTTSNSVSINWNHTSNYNAGYQFAYNVGTTPPADCTSGTIVDAGATTTYLEGGLTNGTTYAFRICAYDSSLILSNGVVFSVTTDP